MVDGPRRPVAFDRCCRQKPLTVCVTRQASAQCEYTGAHAIQSAVDRAGDGDIVLLRAGIYVPRKPSATCAYKNYVIRGYVEIRDKRISIVGEAGAVLDGGSGPPVSAIVVEGGEVSLRGLTLRNFRAGDTEDDLYEGHGVFVIDAAATLSNVTIEKYAKMALTGRGTTRLVASQMNIRDGHVAIWLEESAHLTCATPVVRNNDSAGVAAYANSVSQRVQLRVRPQPGRRSLWRGRRVDLRDEFAPAPQLAVRRARDRRCASLVSVTVYCSATPRRRASPKASSRSTGANRWSNAIRRQAQTTLCRSRLRPHARPSGRS